ncbi:hypothetical protein [Bacillus sp. JJ722]|uniref:hypothetical protein n=1 Tax=Bacillus sp. JJ722 TaxID=3122973 RepID=UPI002FFD9EA9
MKQLSIYNELGLEDDPVYIMISELRNKSSIVIGKIKIHKNQYGLYEIISSEIHECASDLLGCYETIIKGEQHEAFSW